MSFQHPHLHNTPERMNLKRNILIAYPAGNPDYDENFYKAGQQKIIRTLKEIGVAEQCNIVAQVNTRLNGEAGWPENLNLDASLNMYHKTEQELEKTYVPSGMNLVGVYADHEPKYTDSDGRTHHWMNRTRYASRDIEFADAVFKEMYPHNLPNTIYGIPLIPKAKRMSWWRLRNIRNHLRMVENGQYVWLNYYPHAVDDYGTIDANRKKAWQDCIQFHTKVYAQAANGKPVVPSFFPRYGRCDNKAILEAGMNALIPIREVRSILIWVNPHTPTMATVYSDKLREIADPLVKWIES